MTALTVFLAFFVQQADFQQIIVAYLPLFGLYAWGCSRFFQQDFKFYLVLAVLLRLLLLFSFPNLSNDVYRFIWDGRLLVQGFNPFDHLPLWYLENGVLPQGIDRQLFEAFGAKNTYTCYPPVAQAQFASACWLFPNNVFWCVVAMKGWLFAFELGSIRLIIKLLRRFHKPPERVFWYALNPLVLLEVNGNLHFEGAMLFFLLLAIYWISVEPDLGGNCSERVPLGKLPPKFLFLSALAFALSICSKLLTAMFLPFFIKRIGWRKSIAYFAITGVATLLLFLPVVNAVFLKNLGASLSLYFQKMEFNGSLYYLARWVGWQMKGYNVIATAGPALGLLAMLGILVLAFFEKKSFGERKGKNKKMNFFYSFPFSLHQFSWGGLPERLLFAFCIYLFCATTVHPWYLVLPLGLCVFTKYRFPVVWSGLIFFTYVNYSYQPYRENLWVVALEYSLLFGWLLVELFVEKNSRTPLISPLQNPHSNA